MAFRIDPPQSTQSQVQRLAADRIDNALEHLSKIGTADDSAAAAHVHAVRRRCKQVRALARLVHPALGDDFAPFNLAVRDAARALAPARNAHVSEQLLRALDTTERDDTASGKATPDDVRTDIGDAVDNARDLLRTAGRLAAAWELPDGFAAFAGGLERTYRRGRAGLDATRTDPTADHLHEWRKDVKDLWYQLRLLEPIAPSMLGPLIEQIDMLGEDLGHHHDITLLIEGLETERRHVKKRRRKHPDQVPDAARALADIDLATDRAEAALHHLGRSAIRTGATIYAERPAHFISRLGAYWDITADAGPEASAATRNRSHWSPS